MKNATYNLRMRMQTGEKVFGQLIGHGNDPKSTVRALKDFGYDFIMVDLEHSLVNKETVYSYIGAAKEADIPILIRPEENNAHFRCYLDCGVNGLMLPRTDTVEEISYAINQAYFPPIGHRGSGIRDSSFLVDFHNPDEVPFITLTEYINKNTIVLPQTESLEGISNLYEILRLTGVTGTIVGPFDLALESGSIDGGAVRSEIVNSPFMREKLKQIAEICHKAGKVAGLGGLSPKLVAYWAKHGYQLFLLGYIRDGQVNKMKQLIEEVKSLLT